MPGPPVPSPRIGIDDVRHVARLARLSLTDEQADLLARELAGILGHMDVLARVDTTDVPEYAATPAPALRADEGPAIPLLAPPEAFAPEMRDGFFVVPRLASHADQGS